MNSSNDKLLVPEQIAEIYDGRATGLGALQKLSAAQAAKYGFLRECCEDRRDFYRQSPYYDGLEDGLGPLRRFEQFIKAKEEQMKIRPVDITSGVFVLGTSTAVVERRNDGGACGGSWAASGLDWVIS